MVRISSGSLGGRYIQQPPQRITRPLTDKVRQALFNVVGPVDGAVVLDAYSGSGAVAFESLSRGAAMAEAIEVSPKAAKVIEQNAGELGLNWGFLLSVMTVETWLAQPANQRVADQKGRYDLIFADPPYAKLDEDVLARLGAFLAAEGVMAVSHTSKRPAPVLESLQLVQNKVYGDSALSFYSRR